MENDEHAQEMTYAQVIQKARDIISHMEKIETKGNALLLAYDSDKETFQMLAINADIDEVKALILGCVASLQAGLQDLSEDRTIN